ncbi:hypothetical protein HOT75_gp003 [Gordonia phage Daredevil]|uniref:Uncharacterized protein n=1 Tax=Gordonia phage Daredevil TaxID=2283286 RepID=A0A345MIL0_9CAUD|nr:hypothetical protein HOT75_gp003 [Gordonia phage Daredevil]AXH70391.1 hypothetical protein SEA_DAREDEVIL_3 [Gordonia phage Daredevil]
MSEYVPAAAEIKKLRDDTRSTHPDGYYRAPYWLCRDALIQARGDQSAAVEFMCLVRA